MGCYDGMTALQRPLSAEERQFIEDNKGLAFSAGTRFARNVPLGRQNFDDPRDAGHIKSLDRGGKTVRGNLEPESQKYNRGWRRRGVQP